MYEMRSSSGESSISYSLSLVEALFVWRDEDVIDTGSNGVVRHISHGATSICVESAWVIQQVDTVLHHDLKEALTVLLLRCFINFETCIRCEVQEYEGRSVATSLCDGILLLISKRNYLKLRLVEWRMLSRRTLAKRGR